MDEGDRVVIDTTGIDIETLLKVKTDKPESVVAGDTELERIRKEKEFAGAETGWFWVPKENYAWIKTTTGGKLVITKQDR